MEKINKSDYEKAIKLITEYTIQNNGFYAKLITRSLAKKNTDAINYYDNLQSLVSDAMVIGMNGDFIIEECVQISREEYELNTLPF